jgi:AcrR family transcriptional regulator
MDPVAASSPEKRRGGRNRLLTTEAIAQAAFTLLDAEGAGALTIKRLAAELGVGQMTLYGYAASKEAIVDLLPDILLADLPPLAQDDQWQAAIEDCFTGVYHRLIEHRNVTQTIAQSPVFGQAQVRLFESVLEVLHRAGFTPSAAYSLHRTASTYTIGFALFEITESSGRAPHRHRLAELSAAEFPRIAELVPSVASREYSAQFRDGLRRILAGFASSPAN